MNNVTSKEIGKLITEQANMPIEILPVLITYKMASLFSQSEGSDSVYACACSASCGSNYSRNGTCACSSSCGSNYSR